MGATTCLSPHRSWAEPIRSTSKGYAYFIIAGGASKHIMLQHHAGLYGFKPDRSLGSPPCQKHSILMTEKEKIVARFANSRPSQQRTSKHAQSSVLMHKITSSSCNLTRALQRRLHAAGSTEQSALRKRKDKRCNLMCTDRQKRCIDAVHSASALSLLRLLYEIARPLASRAIHRNGAAIRECTCRCIVKDLLQVWCTTIGMASSRSPRIKSKRM